jgi:hypothetical protein
MWTLTAVVVSLTGGVCAAVGTVVWLVLLLARRARGARVAVRLQDLRRVWGISAFIGIPLIFPWMPRFIVASGEAVMPYLYVACVLMLAANVSIGAGTTLFLVAVGIARFLGLLASVDVDPIRIRWQMALVWIVSLAIGMPALTSKTSALVQAVALGSARY